EGWWLDDYALFLALREANGGFSWREWPQALIDRNRHALDEARQQLEHDILFHQYTQWLAETQWKEARAAAHVRGIGLFGDLPFVANTDSPEVWVHADEFRLD